MIHDGANNPPPYYDFDMSNPVEFGLKQCEGRWNISVNIKIPPGISVGISRLSLILASVIIVREIAVTLVSSTGVLAVEVIASTEGIYLTQEAKSDFVN